MIYKEIIKKNWKNGSEEVMNKSVELVDALLMEMKAFHKDKYWLFMRKQQGLMSGGHYDEDFARYDVGQMWHIDKQGRRVEGEHWSLAQAKEVMQSNGISAPNNEYDVYVALNAFWHDLACVEEYDEIVKLAVAFWFKDSDFSDKVGKIWWYMCAKKEMEE